MTYIEQHLPLSDALRFSVTDEGGCLRFEWLRLEGLPESPQINPVLLEFFKDRCIEDIDFKRLQRVLLERVGRRHVHLAAVIDKYCRFLVDLHDRGLQNSRPPAGRFVESACPIGPGPGPELSENTAGAPGAARR